MVQEFVEEIEETCRDLVNEMVHTAIPGKIVSYNPDRNLAKVKPVGRYSVGEDETLDYPVISDVPLVFPYNQKSNIGIVFPVAAGDSCLIIVSEIELDEWRKGAKGDGTLKFDLTSSVAIPGLLKKGNDYMGEACREKAVIVQSDNTLLKIGSSKMEATVKEKKVLTVTKDGITVDGNIILSGTVKNG